jgi:abhydrolase domain-containing protein 6
VNVRRIVSAALAALVVSGLVLYAAAPERLLGVVFAVQRTAARMARRTIRTASGPVPYLDGGRGPVVLLLHGYQDSKESYVAMASRLVDRYHVLIPDMAGFGDNHAEAHGDYRPPAQARRMRAFLQALGVSSVHVAGVSMGGEVAVSFAAQYPEMTQSLALISSAGTRSDTVTPLGQRLLRGDDIFHVSDRATLDTLIHLIGDSGFTLPGFVKRAMLREYYRRNPQWDSVFAQLTEPGMLYLTDSLAPGIMTPTLVLWGFSDPIFHRSTVTRLGARLPHRQLAVLPDCGHLCPATRPVEVAQRYRAFLESVGGRTASESLAH